MTDMLTLNQNYSTTRLLTKEKPVLEHTPEDTFETRLFLPENKARKGEGGLRTKGYFKKSYEDKPLISVVTVVFNGEKHLEQTIQSVINQSYDNVEYIIVDGGSTDGTLDIIRKYEDAIDYWVSESDSGIYDAMNKGVSLAVGEYLAFMNADDWFEYGAIELVANRSLEQNPDYIFGDLNRIFDDDTIELHKGDLSTYKKYTPIGHQALFVKSKILKEMPFDLKYRIMADYDSMIKLIDNNFTSIYIDKSLASFRLGGVSSTSEDKDKERFDIQYKNFGLIYAVLGYLRGTKQPMIYIITSKLLKLKKKYEDR